MEEPKREEMYAAVLNDIERRIAELQQTASNIRAIMGQTAEIATGNSTTSTMVTTPATRQQFKGGDPLSLVKVGDFYGKSYTEAAREFLRRVGEPQNTLTILSAMRKSAYEMKGKNPAGVLYTSLKRHNGFLLVHRNTWGLKEWYPGVEKKKPEPNKQRKVTKSSSKKAKKQSARQAKTTQPVNKPKTNNSEAPATTKIVREALSDGKPHSLDTLVKRVKEQTGKAVPNITVLSVLRMKEFEKIGGEYKLRDA